MDGVSKLLSTDGFITVNKAVIRELGLHEAILLGEFCSEYNYWEKCNKLEDDMFYSTRDNIEYNTGLNEHYQRKALKTLQNAGIIIVKRKGLPAVNYYKIDFDKILTLLSTRCSRDKELEVNEMNLNNSKQTIISKKEVLSKDNTTEFSFGGKKLRKDNLYTKCVSLIDAKTSDKEVRTLLVDWLNMLLEKYRERGKILYLNVFKGKLNMLDKYDTADWKEIIEYNLQKGYEGFYPIPINNSYYRRVDEGTVSHVPSMTEEDYRKQEEYLREMEERGEQVRF